MGQKQKILEFRDRLDKTLASPTLANKESIENLVRNQLLRSSFCGTGGDIEDVIQRRTKEVSNFVEMSRSSSQHDRDASRTHGTSHGDWKLKQDDGQLRVMYREGPQGTPFHTLLVEGYVDGPVDVCLCVSWESILYKKWWPQFSIPTFKIVQSNCLKQVRIGEEISQVRVKVPWPVSAREAIVHYFELECFEDDLIIVLMNTVSDGEDIHIHTHGFTAEGIPEAKDTVRIDMVGGMALQKVSSNKSYFRTIANFDLKIDFIPATFINFVSRQLIGSGFKLYQKAVASVENSDDDFRKALEEKQMYIRIRESLNSNDKVKDSNVLEYDRSSSILTDEHMVETVNTDASVDTNGMMVGKIEDEEAGQATDINPVMVGEIEDEEAGQVRESLNSNDKVKDSNVLDYDRSSSILTDEHMVETVNTVASVDTNGMMVGKIEDEKAEQATDINPVMVSEIEDEEAGQVFHLDLEQHMCHLSTNQIAKQHRTGKGAYFISPEVEQALFMLDKAIDVVRGHGHTSNSAMASSSTKHKLLNVDCAGNFGLTSSEAGFCFDARDAPGTDGMDKISDKAYDSSTIQNFSCADTDLSLSEGNNHLGKSESRQFNPNHPMSDRIQEELSKSSSDGLTNASMFVAPMPQRINGVLKMEEIKANGPNENGAEGGRETCKRRKKRKQRICCL